jgi:uncharacterized protein (DUF1697 family)
VKSFISSGNILFESPEQNAQKIEEIIEKGTQKILGIEIPTIVKSKDELEDFISTNPFQKAVHSRETYLMVTFLKKSVQPHDDSLKNGWKYDKKIHALYGMLNTIADPTTDYMVKTDKLYSKAITSRTYNTVQRIVAKL